MCIHIYGFVCTQFYSWIYTGFMHLVPGFLENYWSLFENEICDPFFKDVWLQQEQIDLGLKGTARLGKLERDVWWYIRSRCVYYLNSKMLIA